jgi:hypothetical protein
MQESLDEFPNGKMRDLDVLVEWSGISRDDILNHKSGESVRLETKRFCEKSKLSSINSSKVQLASVFFRCGFQDSGNTLAFFLGLGKNVREWDAGLFPPVSNQRVDEAVSLPECNRNMS